MDRLISYIVIQGQPWRFWKDNSGCKKVQFFLQHFFKTRNWIHSYIYSVISSTRAEFWTGRQELCKWIISNNLYIKNVLVYPQITKINRPAYLIGCLQQLIRGTNEQSIIVQINFKKTLKFVSYVAWTEGRIRKWSSLINSFGLGLYDVGRHETHQETKQNITDDTFRH